jgi:hypothetical protein
MICYANSTLDSFVIMSAELLILHFEFWANDGGKR